MKRMIAIFLLLFLFLNTCGLIVYYYYNKAEIRKEIKILMKSNLSKDKIIVLQIEKKSKFFQRIHNKEFRYKGKMYDVIKEIPKKYLTIFYCINDEKEEQLIQSYSKLFERSDDGIITVKFSGNVLKNIFFPLFIVKNYFIAFIACEIIIFNNLTAYCLSNFTEVELPPPKILN